MRFYFIPIKTKFKKNIFSITKRKTNFDKENVLYVELISFQTKKICY